MKMKFGCHLLILCLLLLFPAAAWAEPLGEVRDLIRTDYVTQVDAAVLEKPTIAATMEALNDPYSTYIEPERLKEFLSSLDGEYVGVGMYIEQVDKICRVSSPIPGSPAEKAGIQPGDVILRVNGVSMAGLTASEVAGRIRGPEGTQVTVTIQRDDLIRTYTLIRQPIHISSVEYYLIGPATGYILLNGFNSDSPAAMKNALDRLAADGAENLVLDLRDNPGGLLDVAVSLAGEFVPKGAVVHVVQRGDKEYTLNTYKTPRSLPLSVLVNGNTASAAEILAGAIQDADSGTLVGTKTFGKGSVQTIYTLSNSGGLKLTIAKYLTRDRHEVNAVGLTPDIVAAEADQQLAAGVAAIGPDLALYDFLSSLESPTYFAGSKKGRLPATPYILNGNLMVPLRSVATSLGASVLWQAGNTVVTTDQGEIVINAARQTVLVDGISGSQYGRVVLRQGQLMVPLKLLTTAMGYQTRWYPDNKSVAVFH